MKLKDLTKLVSSFLLVAIAATIGSLVTFQAIPTWYAALNKTVISPPDWVFAPAWTILYILMAMALFLIWREEPTKKQKEALQLFGAQLVSNAAWSIIFFGTHLIFTAFIEIILLLTLIIWTTIWFYRVNKIAGYLMIPYILWVGFAAILNFSTWLVNQPR